MTLSRSESSHRWKRYPKYRDLGVEWLGEVPEGWDVLLLKNLFSHTKETNHPEKMLLSIYREQGVTPYTFGDDNFNRPSEDLSNYQLVRKGDLVINKMKCWQGSLAISELEGIISPAYIVCHSIKKFEKRYLHYLLRSPQYIEQYQRFSYGVRCNQWDIRFEDFRLILGILPPENEQRMILAFLDYETARIHDLIAKKERQIELLLEKRAALISHAVTKGLDPNVKMKDSGIEWIGAVPEHWDVKRIRNVCKIRQGQIDPKDESYNQWILISPDHVESGTGRILKLETAQEQEAISGKLISHTGDVIYCKIRPALNKVCISKGDWLCSADMYPIKVSNQIINNFLLYYFLSQQFVNLMVNESMRVAMPKINRDTLKSCPILVPPVKEQMSIIHNLDHENTRIDALIEKVRYAIDLLKEYRTALISAAVTGKIDVRGEVPQTQS